MYKLDEQETTISVIEYTGEIDVYSCTPRIVEQIMKVAAKNRLSIKVIDVEGSNPKAVQMTVNDFNIVSAIMQVA